MLVHFTGLHFGNVTLRREEDPVRITAIYSSFVQVIFGVNNSMADITVMLSQEFRGRTQGLLGMLLKPKSKV